VEPNPRLPELRRALLEPGEDLVKGSGHLA